MKKFAQVKKLARVWTISLLLLLLSPLFVFGAVTPAKPESVVSVYQVQNARGESWGGSGWVAVSDGTQSIVLTNNHVMSTDLGGPFRPPAPNTPAIVVHNDKKYKGKVILADPSLDVCAIVVDAGLPAARFSKRIPKVGSKVYRYGVGTGSQECEVLPTNLAYLSPTMHFTVKGKSESGDSGSAYYNEDGEVVAIHCGKDEKGNPRGTPATYVKVWVVKEVTPRFPRLAKLFDYLIIKLIDRLVDELFDRPRFTKPYVQPLQTVKVGKALNFLPYVTPKTTPLTAPRIVVPSRTIIGYRQVCGVDQYGRRICYLVPVYDR